ncbi:hypothetical protein GCM10020370_41050 [Paenibacillus hodogayensis]
MYQVLGLVGTKKVGYPRDCDITKEEPYSITTIPENLLSDLFENVVTQFVKENLEPIMKAEMKHVFDSLLT